MISGLALFPGGATGAGLLLLRFSVAGSLLALNALRFGAISWLELLVGLASIALCVGLQTRIVAAFSFGITIYCLSADSFSPHAIACAVDGLALVLTGPGAWSVDAVLFGHRVVTLPDR